MKTDKVEYEKELNRTFALGIGTGMSRAAEKVLEHAGQIFTRVRNSDDEAQRLRALSDELKLEAEVELEKARIEKDKKD